MAILTNAGGPGILAADACEANGLELPALSESTRVELRAFLPAAASVANPVDMLASAPPDHYQRALSAILRDDQVDSVIVIFIPPLVTQPDAVAAAIAEGGRSSGAKPVLAVFMRAEGAPASLGGIPSYAFPESAAVALARVAAYGRWRRLPPTTKVPLTGIDDDRARRTVRTVLERGGGWTTPEEGQALMSAVGITTPASRVASTRDQVIQAAREVTYPVAMKALGPTLLHKTERQAVSLHIQDEAALVSAYESFRRRFGTDMTSTLVQQMIPAGVEMLVGAVQDPVFGPLIACGTGGTLVDLLQDTVFRLHPIDQADAAGMIDEVRGVRLLRGYRGSAPADEPALRDILLRVSALVTVAPEIQELDLNPVIVLTSGAWAADVRVRIERPVPRKTGRRIDY